MLADEIEEKATYSGPHRTFYYMGSNGNAVLNYWETTGGLSDSVWGGGPEWIYVLKWSLDAG